MTKKKSGTKSDPPLRFDVEVLRAAAGDKVFARGQAYFTGGQVEILGIERKRLHARVVGTQIYRTELRTAGRRILGEMFVSRILRPRRLLQASGCNRACRQ